jgi:hypothetical protein
LKKRCSCRMADGFSKKKSVRDPDWLVIVSVDTFPMLRSESWSQATTGRT